MRSLSVIVLLATCACAPASGVDTPAPRAGTTVTPTSTGIEVRLGDVGGEASALIEADSARVWAALPQVFEALGVPAGVLDESTRTYGNPRFTGSRIGESRTDRLVRCGLSSGAGAGGYRIRLSISSRVHGQPDGRTVLSTSVDGLGTTVEGTSTAPVRCVSTGEIEALIATLAERLATGG